jgi:endonuclease YncB( thermonuclease family)
MRQRAHLLLAFLLLLLIAVPCHAVQFKATRVYDGDTIKAEGHDIEIKVHLVGIDAPETSKGKREPGQPSANRPQSTLPGSS